MTQPIGFRGGRRARAAAPAQYRGTFITPVRFSTSERGMLKTHFWHSERGELLLRRYSS